MFKRMSTMGGRIENVDICMIGGANVLKDPDNIGKSNIDSITKLLKERQLRIKSQAVGGTQRRSLSFDIEKGCIFYTEGNNDKGLLWVAEEQNTE